MLAPGQPRMHFIAGMTLPRQEPHLTHWTVEEFTAAVAAKRGPHLNEVLTEGFAKPYFDSDQYYLTKQDAAEHERVFACFKANLLTLLDGQPGFSEEHLIYGQRHGKDPKHPEKPFKISFRAYLPGFKVHYPRLKELIEAKGLSGNTDGLLDTEVYKPNQQLLACMGCSKGEVFRKDRAKRFDSRVLQPVGPPHAPEEYLVQHLRGDERELLLPEPSVPAGLPPPASATAMSAATSADARASDAVDVEHVRKVLALLSDSRWDDRALWIKYGMALWHLAGDKLKAAWKERSQSYAQYDEQAADTAWASFGKGTFAGRPVTFGTICHHAKEDDPAGYARVQAEFAGDKVGGQ